MKLNRIFAGLIACAVMGVSLPYVPYVNVNMVSASEEAVTASGQCGEALTWNLDEEGVLTVSGTGDMPDFSYSEGSNPAPWCEYGSFVKKVIIEEGVTSIGMGAFNSNIEDVFPTLTEINIPSTVTEISEYRAIYYCDQLLSVNVADDNKNYCSVDGVLFSEDMTKLLLYPAQKTGTSYAIPETVVSISENAFYNNQNITTITIPDSVTYIGSGAFGACKNLSELSFSENIEYIGSNAFMSTAWLNKQKETDPVVYVNNILVDGKGASGELIIPDGVTAICGCAFVEWSDFETERLVSVVIPDSVKYIGNLAFYGNIICATLENVTLPENGMYIDTGAFSGTPWLEAQKAINPMVISNNTIIEARECEDNPAIPENVVRIAGEAFYNNTNLTKITIPESVTEIGIGAFNGCSNLAEITILNPECDFLIHYDARGEMYEIIPTDAVIYGYSGSTAQTYADKYGYTFVALDDTPSETVYGDANCDGDVLVNDAVLAMAYATNPEACTISEQGLLNADVYQSGDGVAVTDAAAIQKYLTKLIDTLPES